MHYADMVDFRKYRAGVASAETTEVPFTIPEHFYPLVALLVQDRYIHVDSLKLRCSHFANISLVMRLSLHCPVDSTIPSVNLMHLNQIQMSQVLVLCKLDRDMRSKY
jgi:hypothetical protein